MQLQVSFTQRDSSPKNWFLPKKKKKPYECSSTNYIIIGPTLFDNLFLNAPSCQASHNNSKLLGGMI